jgi:uncharacterized membrane protein (TIGR02234 family)
VSPRPDLTPDPAPDPTPDPAVGPTADPTADPTPARAPEPVSQPDQAPPLVRLPVPMPVPGPAPARSRAGRARAAGVLLLAAALTGVCAVPEWVSATSRSVLGGEVTVAVSGGSAAPTLVAAALVLLAATAAVALVGRVGRWVVVASVALAGALVVAGAVDVLRDPLAAVLPAVVAQTGVERVVGDVSVSVWPWVAVVIGVLDLLAAIWLARESASWAVSRRHEQRSSSDEPAPASPGAATPGVPGPDDERSQWDALSRGDDPT